jgi:hypothetical protein
LLGEIIKKIQVRKKTSKTFLSKIFAEGSFQIRANGYCLTWSVMTISSKIELYVYGETVFLLVENFIF